MLTAPPARHVTAEKSTRIGIHQCAVSGLYLNSTKGVNTHNALLDAFVLSPRHNGALTHFFSSRQVILGFH